MKQHVLTRSLTPTVFAMALFSCSPRVNVKVEGPGIQSKQSLEDPPSNTGIKNYEEVYLTFQGLTGLMVEDVPSDPLTAFVPPQLNGNCVNTGADANPHTLSNANSLTLAQAKNLAYCMYNRENSSLASTKNLSSFVGNNPASIQKLATAFCDAVFRTPTLRSNLMGADIVPNQTNLPPPNVLFSTEAKKDAFVTKLISQFWTPVATNPDLGTTKAQMMQLLNNFLAQVRQDQELASITVGIAMCTPLLASAPVTMR